MCVSELPPHLEHIKQQANDAFARQQWTQAIQLYSLGIHTAGQSNAMLYGNRAAAYMKRKWYGLKNPLIFTDKNHCKGNTIITLIIMRELSVMLALPFLSFIIEL